MKIVRLGRPRRIEKYLDLVANDDVELLTVFSREEEKDRLSLELMNARFDCNDLVKKIRILPEPLLKSYERSWKRIQLEKLMRTTLGMKSHETDRKRWRERARKIQPHLERADLIWFGDSDLDNPCEWLVAVADLQVNVPKILSLKETRYKRKYFEEMALNVADGVIFPHEGYLGFIKSLYGTVPANVEWADPNYPASHLTNWLREQAVEKMSTVDGRPHACILTRSLMGESGKTSPRSGARYYMLDEVQDLMDAGMVVHLHAAGKGDDGAIPREYLELEEKTESFVIERPLTLIAGSSDYLTLAKYDFGVLHPSTVNASKGLRKFQEINVPNRYFEYLAVGLNVLVRKGSLRWLEESVSAHGGGLVWSNADDLKGQLVGWLSNSTSSDCPAPCGSNYRVYAESLQRCYRNIPAGQENYMRRHEATADAT